MAFRIDYFKEGLLAGSTPHPGPQHETEKFAKDGMIRHRADFYRIVDVGSNAEVASGPATYLRREVTGRRCQQG